MSVQPAIQPWVVDAECVFLKTAVSTLISILKLVFDLFLYLHIKQVSCLHYVHANAFLLEYFISFILFLIKVHSSKSCPIFYCCFSLLSLPFILFLFFKRHDVLYSKSLIVDRAYDKRGWLHFDSQCGSSPSGFQSRASWKYYVKYSWPYQQTKFRNCLISPSDLRRERIKPRDKRAMNFQRNYMKNGSTLFLFWSQNETLEIRERHDPIRQR